MFLFLNFSVWSMKVSTEISILCQVSKLSLENKIESSDLLDTFESLRVK